MGKSIQTGTEFESTVLNQIYSLQKILDISEPEGGCMSVECVDDSDRTIQRDLDGLKLRVAEARIGALEAEALCRKEIADILYDKNCRMREELLRIEGEFYRCNDQYDGIRSDIQAKVSDVGTRILEYQRMEEDEREQIARIEGRISKAGKKKKDASGWKLLIPGYNIYLVADALSDGDVANLNGLKQQCECRKRARKEIEGILAELEQELSTGNSQADECIRELLNMKKSIARVCDDIGRYGKEIQKWDDLYCLYSNMKDDIEEKGLKSKFVLNPQYI